MQAIARIRTRLLSGKLRYPAAFPLLSLVNGLTRRMLLRRGVQTGERRLQGMPINLYYASSQVQVGPEIPILLVHGIADSALTWAQLIGPLRTIGPVYAVDLPGFGLSGYPPGRSFTTFDEQLAVLQELISTVIGQPALVVGNSLGGWLGARLASTAPELTTGVVMLNPGGALLSGRGAWQSFVDSVGVRDLRAVRQIYRQMFGCVTRLPLYLGQRNFQELFTRKPVREFVAVATEDDFLSAAELRRLAVPVALVWGLADHFLPVGSLEYFRDNLPDPALLLLPNCGHLPQRERPRQVVRFIQEFARTLCTRAAPPTPSQSFAPLVATAPVR